MKRFLLGVLILLAVLAAAYAAYRLHRMERYAQQLRNLATGRDIVNHLDNYKRTHGQFPLAINRNTFRSPRLQGDDNSLRDPWGHPYLYFSDGTWFILVSCGDDGVPDRTDYLQIRNEPEVKQRRQVYSICGKYSADQVLSDLGEHRMCGK
jgi:type II secretory pathway pseudopilin PulG